MVTWYLYSLHILIDPSAKNYSHNPIIWYFSIFFHQSNRNQLINFNYNFLKRYFANRLNYFIYFLALIVY